MTAAEREVKRFLNLQSSMADSNSESMTKLRNGFRLGITDSTTHSVLRLVTVMGYNGYMAYKDCGHCGKPYKIKPSHMSKSTYCSKSCMALAYRERLTGEANPNFRDSGEKTCQLCGSTYRSYDKKRKYCSTRCAGTANAPSALMAERSAMRETTFRLSPPRVGRKSTCLTCGVIFAGRRDQCSVCRPFRVSIYSRCVVCLRKFKGDKATCGDGCLSVLKSKRQLGELSHRWIGGKTEADRIARNSNSYAAWRSSVFRRDNFTCAICSQRGRRLAAHHIKRWAHHAELRYDVNNGVCLCWSCHGSIKGKEEMYEEVFFKYAAQNAIDQMTVAVELRNKGGQVW